jgi:hypothetical protein
MLIPSSHFDLHHDHDEGSSSSSSSFSSSSARSKLKPVLALVLDVTYDNNNNSSPSPLLIQALLPCSRKRKQQFDNDDCVDTNSMRTPDTAAEEEKEITIKNVSVSNSECSETISCNDDNDDYTLTKEEEKEEEEEKEALPVVMTAAFPMIMTSPPDAMFIVKGIEFPCHTQILTQRKCYKLLDLLAFDGIESSIQQQNSNKKQKREHDPQDETRRAVTVVEIFYDRFDPDIFHAFMEFLYSNEISNKNNNESYCSDDNDQDQEEEEEEENSSLPCEVHFSYDDDVAKEDLDWDDDDDGDNHEVSQDSQQQQQQQEEQEQEQHIHSLHSEMKFLQKLCEFAIQYDCIDCKLATEYRIYDEYLYVFTAHELYVWADKTNNCFFLKEMASKKINKNTIMQKRPHHKKINIITIN